MSNTATVTPYSPAGPGLIATLYDAFARTDAERETVDRFREMARRDRLDAVRLRSGFASPSELFAAASSLGLVKDRNCLLSSLERGLPVELADRTGESIVLRSSAEGLDVVSTKGGDTVRDLVRSITIARAEQHLTHLSRGKVERRRLPGGSVELRAREAEERPGGAATVTTTVDVAGMVQVDISGTCGGECVGILDKLADALGGEVESRQIKPDYYSGPAAPGEPVHI